MVADRHLPAPDVRDRHLGRPDPGRPDGGHGRRRTQLRTLVDRLLGGRNLDQRDHPDRDLGGGQGLRPECLLDRRFICPRHHLDVLLRGPAPAGHPDHHRSPTLRAFLRPPSPPRFPFPHHPPGLGRHRGSHGFAGRGHFQHPADLAAAVPGAGRGPDPGLRIPGWDVGHPGDRRDPVLHRLNRIRRARGFRFSGHRRVFRPAVHRGPGLSRQLRHRRSQPGHRLGHHRHIHHLRLSERDPAGVGGLQHGGRPQGIPLPAGSSPRSGTWFRR